MLEKKSTLHHYFEQFPDHRISRNKKHLLSDIIILSILGVLCGAESWDSIEAFGKTKLGFLKGFLKLPHGIPSHDTINRVFSGLRPKLFEKMFVEWAGSLKNESIKKEVISIDGKSIRGSRDSFHSQSPIHMVSAWASSNELVLGQLKVSDKSNEITAIPLLLELLDIEGSIVTIDAMGTQVDIAQKIVENKADYILSVKGNQQELSDQIKGRFENQLPADADLAQEKGHGRIESRKCEVITDLTFIDNSISWASIKSVVRISSTREIGNKVTTEQRYYISSLSEKAAHFNSYIRLHWGVENKLHWSLDMIFNEDRQRKRTKNAADNFSYIRKIGLNLLKKDTSKGSLVTKRLKAGWEDKYLMQIFNQI
ncbi:ISAs1 family transposase [Sphingobacterium athyrii]|uniref:ISAs1 family transposase n=2 Tax=Sphingobacterium athyrii TaxID=2152717 RepID=A0A363NLJ3_9SPHI|nr:ISAs1 family transposase [Sphingobacterium athyrii]PUV21587.1 ISAs1 family transposase [Sphingobacterium athyrii]